MNSRSPVRHLLVAVCATLVVTLAACAQPRTIEPYQPGVGADTSAGSVKLRALTIVMTDDTTGTLTGAMVASSADELTSITGTALTTQLTPSTALTITADKTVTPPQTLVPFTKVAVSGDGLVPGLVAQLTFVFAQGGAVTVMVPIVAASK